MKRATLILLALSTIVNGLSKPTDSLLSRSFAFPKSGNALWYRSSAANWVLESLPIGNGYMGASVFSGVQNDTILVNLDNLWAGGPFADPAYNGANWGESDVPAVHQRLKALRETIFANGTANDLNGITPDAGQYGTFASAGSLVVSRPQIISNYTNYTRWLDLDDGVIRSTWSEGYITFRREYICSYPDHSCSHKTSASQAIPKILYSIVPIADHSDIEISCKGNSTLVLRARAGANGMGMLYEVAGSVRLSGDGSTTCSNGYISVLNATDIWFTWTGDTEYNINAGTAAQHYSFKGSDPHSQVTGILARVASIPYAKYLQNHLNDYKRGTSQSFSLDLGQSPDWSTPTDVLLKNYQAWQKSRQPSDASTTLLEWILVNYGRYLMFSSARGNLPANLQGVWSQGAWSPWSGDYHANINVQMMYWPVEVTGMDVTQTLWDFIQKTVVPRGGDTAQTLYNVSRGWVMHDETNIFGSTGMKGLDIPNYNPAEWTNYAAAGAWLMTHVWDHFDFTGDIAWLKRQGYPLLKATAEYWLDALQVDAYSKDGSLVVNPCNSPELPQTTFGCTHWQQMIWELFNSVDKALSVLHLGSEKAFLEEVRAARSKVDRGFRISPSGVLQEWKLDLDNSDRLAHRHLSPLTGLYPSYSISSWVPRSDGFMSADLSKSMLINASRTLLMQRGNGTSPDADAGWGKFWRAACWAQLGEPTRFYSQLSYGIARNFASNLFSLYNPFNTAENTLFQMDANGGYPAAVLNALVQAPDTQRRDETLVVTLLPALPSSWSRGHLYGVRTRRGLELDLEWRSGKLTKASIKGPRILNGTVVQVKVQGAGINRQITLTRGQSVTLA